MGYETTIYIGKASALVRDEWRRSKRRYSDGSGFMPIKRKGVIQTTGRKEHWFQIMAMMELCKLGYQDDALNRLASASHALGKAAASTEVHYFFGTDGNTQIEEDRCGDAFWPVPAKEVLTAMKASLDPADPYRRLKWAIALLESMIATTDGGENLSVIFFGH